MSCEATPAHASESFEWRIRQHSAEKNSPVNCELLYFNITKLPKGSFATEWPLYMEPLLPVLTNQGM